MIILNEGKHKQEKKIKRNAARNAAKKERKVKEQQLQVEAPKTTSKPFVVPDQEPQVHTDAINNLKNKNLSKPTPGLGKENTIVFGEPAPKAPQDTSKPITINGKKVQKRSLGTGKKKQVPNTTTTNGSSWFGRNKGKVALGIGVGTAAAYGIHRYRQNKKKKEEEEARRQAEEAQKKTGLKRFFK